MSIRSTVKAVIVDGDKILLNRCRDSHNGEYYTLPGGGQITYETLDHAVVRECLEETGYTVQPVRFAALCEEICDDKNFREDHSEYAHKMLHIFLCCLKNAERKVPTETDEMQTGCEWIDRSRLEGIRLLPDVVGTNIQQLIDSDVPLFLGSWHLPFNHG